MGNRLENKVAIVTGGGAGIGEAICKKFAKEGAKVVVCGFPEDPVQQVVDEINSDGGKAISYLGDVSQAVNAQACVGLAVEKFGKLDILINNAGTFPTVSEIDAYPIDAFEYMIKNNIYSTFMMTKFAIPELQKTKGNIVAAGSEAGKLGIAQNTPYGGTKGFNHAFIKGVAVEQAQHGVRANCVCPGAIDTAWTHKETGPMSAEMEKMIVEATPMGRRGTPEEIANVYLFLASDEASYVTGALYSVDGGITINKGATGSKADKSMKAEPSGELDLEHSMEGDPVQRSYSKSEHQFNAKGYNGNNGSNYKLNSGKSKISGGLVSSLIGISAGLAAVSVLWGVTKKGVSANSDADTKRTSGQNPEGYDMQQESAIIADNYVRPEEQEKPFNAGAGANTGNDRNKNTGSNKNKNTGNKNYGGATSGESPTRSGGKDTGFTNEAGTGNVD